MTPFFVYFFEIDINHIMTVIDIIEAKKKTEHNHLGFKKRVYTTAKGYFLFF